MHHLVAADRELAHPLEGAPGYLAAEAHYATTHEGALHLDDVLTRRTRISVETFDRGLAAARNAGIKVVAVSYGYSELPAADLGADAVLADFNELPALLARLP